MLLPALKMLARVPLCCLHRAGVALGWAVYLASPTYARRMRENIHSSGIARDAAASRAILHGAIGEAGKAAMELAAVWFGDERRVATLVAECEHWDVLVRALERGKGAILLTPHLGCFELCGMYIAQRAPLTVLYRPPRMQWLESVMLAGRSRWTAAVAPANLRGVRMLYKALGRGEAIGLLPDQAPGTGDGVWASFFGRPAYTMTLVSRLKQATGGAVIMVVAERLPAGRGYRMHFEELPEDGLDEAALNRAIEAQVRRCPEQYLWSYNRYKTPAGAEPPPGT